jgi:hypothetical protein
MQMQMQAYPRETTYRDDFTAREVLVRKLKVPGIVLKQLLLSSILFSSCS